MPLGRSPGPACLNDRLTEELIFNDHRVKEHGKRTLEAWLQSRKRLLKQRSRPGVLSWVRQCEASVLFRGLLGLLTWNLLGGFWSVPPQWINRLDLGSCWGVSHKREGCKSCPSKNRGRPAVPSYQIVSNRVKIYIYIYYACVVTFIVMYVQLLGLETMFIGKSLF